ncbi:MAG: hypothetical protein IT372_26875 [Polyangiaceae bacterium]|nr:hypothetical protein [Polyangiaceae bacterium]
MRTLSKLLLTAHGIGALALLSSQSRAQSDIDPPAPNVLLLIDSSGSMERTIAGGEPVCTPGTAPPSESDKSRWTVLVEALTGPVQDFSCWAQPRTDTAFVQEYTLGAVEPYDKNYYLPFHRLLSNGCTKAPGLTDDTLREHAWTGINDACGTAWSQLDSGLLDTYRDRVRFSLMTFDTLTNAGTGWNGSADYGSGVAGMWSYFLSWDGGGAPAQGNPPNCAIKDQEVGARNPAAPLWEGPLVPFPEDAAPLADVRATNDRIQNALISMRPYGATPLAGMLTDARDYLLSDTSQWNGKPVGPRDDQYVAAGCRSTSVILISDGEPNLDLRPDCAEAAPPPPGTPGVCPYDQTYEIAHALNTNADPNRRVKTFTVGFGLRAQALAQTGIDCNTITAASDFTGAGKCVGATGALLACCNLARIAIDGGTERGYFPDSAGELYSMMSQILAVISKSTSRTLPVFATATTAASGDADAIAYQFAASFKPSITGELWSGNLERKRYTCGSVNGALTATLQDVDETRGDDFALNLTTKAATRARSFFTVIGDLDAGAQKIWSTRSIRPGVATDDGLGVYSGAVTNSGSLAGPSTFTSELRNAPRALDLAPSAPSVPSQCSSGLLATSAADCAEAVIKWEIGEPSGNASVPDRVGTELGSIYHSTPAVVGPPRDPVDDPAYEIFAQQSKNRPVVLYTATTDGQLHAFQVARGDASDTLKVDHAENNELWSFLPPHVLPRLVPTFNQQAFLLDGAPVVQNIVFERTLLQAQTATSEWHTVLLAGGGPAGGFYYALDVTDPTAPRFLWQLSTDSSGSPLFGDSTPTPAMGMIEVEIASDDVREVAVAFLPGGSAPLGAGSCARQGGASPPMFSPTASLSVRPSARCWGGAAVGNPVGPARTLTVVRLDTGEVLRTFRGDVSEGPGGLDTKGKVTQVNFDSPITGTPVPYPALPGQVADRVYIGDADGTLWRLNLSQPKPSDWTVDLAWDAYSFSGDTAAMSQPIETPPVISVDPLGNKVILFSTGDQEMFTTTGIETRVWSLTEKMDASVSAFKISENWVIPLDGGRRVTGPISLFNEVAYFSTFTPTPPGTYECADGFGTIWGVDYLRTGDPPPGFSPGPAPFPLKRLVPDLSNPTAVHFDDEDPGTMVFGVAVTKTPTCVETETYSDPHFGTQTRISSSSDSQFQLTYQAPKTNNPVPQDTQVPIKNIELKPPRPVVRVDSWASVVE